MGLPSLVGRNKKESFTHIKQQIWKKLQGWEAKLLSQVGREVLIKAVAQALPTYTMSCFKLPITLCHEIEALICRFFWGQRGDRRKIHWTKWQDLCKPKNQGGMGFKDLALYNDALLAKQTWRLLHDIQSLFHRVLKAKFFPNSMVLEAKCPSSASYAWKSIIKGRDVIKLVVYGALDLDFWCKCGVVTSYLNLDVRKSSHQWQRVVQQLGWETSLIKRT